MPITSTISDLPTAPDRADPSTFSDRADTWVASLDGFVTEANALATDFNTESDAAVTAAETAQTNAETAQAAAETAQSLAETAKDEAEIARNSSLSTANLAGVWADLTGPLNVPASVIHNKAVWLLLNDLADVTTSEPGVTADWEASGTGITAPIFAASDVDPGEAVVFRSDGQIEPVSGVLSALGPFIDTTASSELAGISSYDVALSNDGNKMLILYRNASLYVSAITVDFTGGGSPAIADTEVHPEQTPFNDVRTVWNESAQVFVVTAGSNSSPSNSSLRMYTIEFTGSTVTQYAQALPNQNSNATDVALFSHPTTDYVWVSYRDTQDGSRLMVDTYFISNPSKTLGWSGDQTVIDAAVNRNLGIEYLSDSDRIAFIYYSQNSSDPRIASGQLPANGTGLLVNPGTGQLNLPIETSLQDWAGGGDKVGFVYNNTNSQPEVLFVEVDGGAGTFTTGDSAVAGLPLENNKMTIEYDQTSGLFVFHYGATSTDWRIKTIQVKDDLTTIVNPEVESANVGPTLSYTKQIPRTDGVYVFYADTSTGGKFRFRLFTPYTSNYTDGVIGICGLGASAGNQAFINLSYSVNNTFSGLTAGADYYVDATGTFTSNITNSPKIGTAISANGIMVAPL